VYEASAAVSPPEATKSAMLDILALSLSIPYKIQGKGFRKLVSGCRVYITQDSELKV